VREKKGKQEVEKGKRASKGITVLAPLLIKLKEGRRLEHAQGNKVDYATNGDRVTKGFVAYFPGRTAPQTRSTERETGLRKARKIKQVTG